MEDESVLSNQTQFGDESALFTDPTSYATPPVAPPSSEHAAPAKKKRNPLLFVIIGVSALAMLSMVLVLSMGKKNPQMLQTQIPTNQEEQINQENIDLYQARLNELQQDFRAADPTQATLPFPPISLSITLEAAQRPR